jgi:hypothetical protein
MHLILGRREYFFCARKQIVYNNDLINGVLFASLSYYTYLQ